MAPFYSAARDAPGVGPEVVDDLVEELCVDEAGGEGVGGGAQRRGPGPTRGRGGGAGAVGIVPFGGESTRILLGTVKEVRDNGEEERGSSVGGGWWGSVWDGM